MSLDRPRLEAALQSTHLPPNLPLPKNFPNLSLHLFDRVDSTNSIAWNLLQENPSQPAVAIAQSQTAGRGQRGHRWQSDPGGLYLSLGLPLNLSVARAALLTLTSAWGIAIGLRQQQIPVQLKWLNDLVINERKLGGILTESRIRREQIYQAVIGVGINWQNAVPPEGVSLQHFQTPNSQTQNSQTQNSQTQNSQPIDSLETLAAIVIQSTIASFAYWESQDIETFLPAYESLLVNVGQSVTYQGIPGLVRGITAAGELRVMLQPEGSKAIEVRLKPGEILLGYGGGGALGIGHRVEG